jgi:hypothetical protein
MATVMHTASHIGIVSLNTGSFFAAFAGAGAVWTSGSATAGLIAVLLKKVVNLQIEPGGRRGEGRPLGFAA